MYLNCSVVYCIRICLPDGLITAFYVHYYSMGITQFTCGRSGITLKIDPSSLGTAGLLLLTS